MLAWTHSEQSAESEAASGAADTDPWDVRVLCKVAGLTVVHAGELAEAAKNVTTSRAL